MDYEPYTTTHVVTQFQILLFSALAFTVLKRTGIYPPELRSINLDIDWIYRKGLPALIRRVGPVGRFMDGQVRLASRWVFDRAVGLVYRFHGPQGVFARTWTTGTIALWAVLGFLGFLLLYFMG